MKHILFVLANTALTGGNKVLFEIINRLIHAGMRVDVVSYYTPGKQPQWFSLQARILPTNRFESIAMDDYDVAIVAQAFLIPLVAPHLTQTALVYLSQAYESYCYGRDAKTLMDESQTILDILKLPVPIMAVSKNLQQCYREKIDRSVYYLPIGLDKTLFYPRPYTTTETPKRILMVGNYLSPVKGMAVGFDALARLNQEIPVQLVLLTQETRGQDQLNQLPFNVETHHAPPLSEVPDIYASCHVYLCTSHYETMPLPPLEAMSVGVPVVSTANAGITNYGIDGYNMLLTRLNDSADVADKLKRILTDTVLRDRLRQNAYDEVQRHYNWGETIQVLQNILDQEIGYGLHPQLRLRPDQAQAYLQALEQEGYFTPYALRQQYQGLTQAFYQWSEKLLRYQQVDSGDYEALVQIRDRFSNCLGAETTQYYADVKKYIDLCQLLLSIWDEPEFLSHLQKVVHHYEVPELAYR